jgi:flagellar biosynthesis protein FlhF
MIRKFRARTFAEAFHRIKAEMGPDAVILDHHDLKPPPNPNEKVEVIVTLDDISEIPPPPGKSSKDTGKLATYNSKGVKPVELQNAKQKSPEKKTASIPLDKSYDYMESILTEFKENILAEVKKLREDFFAARSEFLEGIRVTRDRLPKEFAHVAAELSKNGFPAQIAQDLLAETMLLCPANSRDETYVKEQMRKVLSNRISIAPRPRLRKGRPLVQMFIGPAGSGKSGVISKLAGKATITGNPNVAIVTTDCYRMGALEQMEAFAAAADIELERIASPEEVPEVFERLRDKSTVLVDTAGRSLKNEEHEAELTVFYEAIRPDEVHLVLPLNMRNRDLENAAEAYMALKANRVVFTRQDEASEQGALLWLPIKYGIPLSYIGNGQGPDNIINAEKEIIANWIIK